MSDQHEAAGGGGDGAVEGSEDDSISALRTSLRRRTLLGGLLGTAAGGVAGAIVADRRIDGGSADGDAGEPTLAGEVRVEPTGELVAEDVQSALVDVVGRSSALARLDDLRVATEVVDDFVSADGRIGAHGWVTAVEGGGSRVEVAADAQGGVVVVDAAGGRAGMHLGLTSQVGLAVFTMEWRVRVDRPGRIVVGAVSAIDGSGDGGLPPHGVYFARDGDAPWSVVASAAGGRTVEETSLTPDGELHRLRITCDGDGIVRFSVDDDLVASLSDDLPREDAYGPGLSVEQGMVAVDWYFCRREMPR